MLRFAYKKRAIFSIAFYISPSIIDRIRLKVAKNTARTLSTRHSPLRQFQYLQFKKEFRQLTCLLRNMVGSLRCSVTTRARNFDRQKAFFIRHSRKFREASSDQVGTKPFYGGNFREISDDDAAFDSLRGILYERMLWSTAAARCCILMVTSASLKDEGRSVEPTRLLSTSSIPVILVSPRIVAHGYAHGKRKRGKLEAKFVLYCLGKHSGASSIVSCILQRRSYREHHAIREIDIGFEFDRAV